MLDVFVKRANHPHHRLTRSRAVSNEMLPAHTPRLRRVSNLSLARAPQRPSQGWSHRFAKLLGCPPSSSGTQWSSSKVFILTGEYRRPSNLRLTAFVRSDDGLTVSVQPRAQIVVAIVS
jgi:hypothetical protein